MSQRAESQGKLCDDVPGSGGAGLGFGRAIGGATGAGGGGHSYVTYAVVGTIAGAQVKWKESQTERSDV